MLLCIRLKKVILCHFEDAQKSQRPQTGEAKGARALAEIDPENLEDGAGDDGAVEAVEGRREVDKKSQSVHTDHHLENESTQKEELGVDCNKDPLSHLCCHHTTL